VIAEGELDAAVPDTIGDVEGNVIYEMLSEEEACLYAILTDPSGLDLAEFTWTDERNPDGCWRAFPYQWIWWRDRSPQQVDQGARSVGKSESVMARVCVFPFVHPGGEMVVTAPESVHVDAITDRIEATLTNTRLLREMLLGGRFGVNHRPFKAKFRNGAMVHSRLPQRSGIGVKGCVGPGTLVLTQRGLVAVEDVVVGDEVLTHCNRWRPVTHTWRFEVDATRVVKGGGHSGLVTSDVHRFYARRNEAGPKQARRLGEADWVAVDDCGASTFWGSPAAFPKDDEPDWPYRPVEALLWLAGAYLANGHIDYGRGSTGERIRFRTHFVVRADKVEEVAEAVAALGLNPRIKPHRDTGARRVEVSSGTLACWLEEHCGRHSHHKHLPSFTYGLGEEQREALLDGYLHGDGHWDERRGRWTVSSASKTLAVGVKLLGQSVGWTASYGTVQPKVTEICGVELKGAPALAHRVALVRPGFRSPVLEAGAQWAKIRDVEEAPGGVVYDLTVDEDHSYVADGIYSHNTHPIWLEMDESFCAGTPVLTRRGEVPIEQVVVGDQVLTHRNQWRSVTEVYERAPQETWVLNDGDVTLRTTEHHKFWARRSPGEAPAWTPASEMADGWMWAVVRGDSELMWAPVLEARPDGVVEPHFDLAVEDHHSFVADGVVVHNSQDYPERGWKEIVETVNWAAEGAQWRCHGVSKGVRDDFYKITQDDSDWKVHHYTAMHRPTWDDTERQRKIEQYGGSVHDPDFRRNVYGVHGDQANNIFVLTRFMACVDTDEGSHYNLEEYFFRRITAEMVDDQVRGASGSIEESSEEHASALIQMLDFPELHHRYDVFWVGMDVGITRDPSEILVFAEYQPATAERNAQKKAGLAVPLDAATRLKLITRLSLLRLPTPLQAEVIMWLVDFYRPRAFSMDRTGNGLPLFQDLQKRALTSRSVVVDDDDFDEDLDEATRAQIRTMRAKHREKAKGARAALTTIKGYPFDGSIVVEIDEERAAELGPVAPAELADKAGIKRRVKDFATDVLRDAVDRQRLLLPYDVEVINQWNAQTWSYAQSPVDAYGRRRMAFSSGTFHTLDAGRMAALGMYLQPLETVLKAPAPKRRPVLPRFG
jgi:hypothetical protein